ALARLKDKEGIAKLKTLVAGEWENNSNPVGGAKASGPQRGEQCPSLRSVCPSSVQLLIETWGTMGPEGSAHLHEAIEHAKSNERLKAEAINLDPVKDKKYLAALATNSDSAPVRAVSLRLLSALDEKQGQKLAESVLAYYASGKPMSDKNPKGDL